jgi:hypothetical protein
MDTRFWGPPGWRMLHLLTFLYNEEHKKPYREFFKTLPYILPCKFCRASLTDYYKKHPLEPALEGRAALTKWLYDVHNEVSAKLRSQGLTTTPDPTFASVERYYNTWIAEGADVATVGWDFLFAVAYNHPQAATASSTPMPDCPRRARTCKNSCTRNKWNTLPLRDRLHWYTRFWASLPALMGPGWQAACSKTPCSFRSRQAAMATLWRLRCSLDSQFHDPYRAVCSRVAAFSSGCSKARKGVTCRRKRT